MKKILLFAFTLIALGIIAQPTTKIKYSQMENPATSSVNLGSQSLVAGAITSSNAITAGTFVPSGAIITPTSSGTSYTATNGAYYHSNTTGHTFVETDNNNMGMSVR